MRTQGLFGAGTTAYPTCFSLGTPKTPARSSYFTPVIVVTGTKETPCLSRKLSYPRAHTLLFAARVLLRRCTGQHHVLHAQFAKAIGKCRPMAKCIES